MNISHKLCVSIGEATFEQIIQAVSKYEFAEIRLDHATLSDFEIEKIFSCGKTLVATCREGRYNRDARLTILKKAIEAGANYVDAETEADDEFRNEILQTAKKHGCKVIISYHNFDNTPSNNELNYIADTCYTQGAHIVKLITTSTSFDDNARVMSLYSRYKNIAAFSMGYHGKITRIASLYSGAPFTYVATSADKITAGGQLAFDDMVEIMKMVEK